MNTSNSNSSSNSTVAAPSAAWRVHAVHLQNKIRWPNNNHHAHSVCARVWPVAVFAAQCD